MFILNRFGSFYIKNKKWNFFRFECRDCWGSNSKYGCCFNCSLTCHRGHDLKKHSGKNSAFVCDCGRNRHKKNICTKGSTAHKYVEQVLFQCWTCFDHEKNEFEEQNSRLVVCFACAGKCHRGHDLSKEFLAKGFCDCGEEFCRVACECRY